MKNFIIIGMVLGFHLIAPTYSVGDSDGIKRVPKLKEQWSTEDVLRIPESVIYHRPQNAIYVSNINGKATEKNNLGFISKLNHRGKIHSLEWATGLNAPKGMAIFREHLYVADIDRLVQIDLKDGKIIDEFPACGAKFLNDVAADSSGRIYVSDTSSSNSAIYCLSEGQLNIWLRGAEIKKPNGLYMDNQRLLVGNSGDGWIKAVDINTLEITDIASVGSGIDGLQPDGKGNYFVSDFKGQTTFVSVTNGTTVLLDTTEEGINAADFYYMRHKRLLIIPTFSDNRAVAYKVKHRNRQSSADAAND